MYLTTSQIRTLENLPIKKWISIPEGTSIITIRKLLKARKIIAVDIPNFPKMTDEIYNTRIIEGRIKPYYHNSDGHPIFIKKIDDTYETQAEEEVKILRDRVEKLENQVKKLAKSELCIMT